MRLVACAVLLVSALARADELVLSNAVLELRLDASTGAVTQVVDRVHSIALVQAAGVAPAARIAAGSGVEEPGAGVAATPDSTFDGTAYDLEWPATPSGLVLHARVELGPADAAARFSAHVDGAAGVTVPWLEYPVIGGIGELAGSPQATELITPFATGYRIVDPLARLAPGDRFAFYPDAYGGAALQQLSYLARDTGGFHLQVEDASGQAKQLDLYRANAWLELAVRWYPTDETPGRGVAAAGPVVLAASASGTWQEGADRYRAWALAQPWAAKGPRRDWPDAVRARWLQEKVGVATFGISVRRDQRKWFSGLRSFIGVPLFHVSGYWWPGGTLLSEWYGGYNDWSDDRVNPANLTTIHGAGDRVALFLFPQHFSRTANEYANPAPDPASDRVAPWQPFAMQPDPESDPWSYGCPATAEWQDFFGWRAVTLMTRHQADGEYFDIGPGLGRVHCTSTSHGHAPGWGTPIVLGVKALLDSRRGEVDAARGRYVPRGTELISELYLDRFDYYQARAGAHALTMLEGDRLRNGVKAGWAEKLPLFDYVYHDYGPLRLDGNLKLAAELGGLFYWVAGRVVLDGGVPELNYELSALERLPGMTGSTWFETYRNAYDCEDRTPYAADGPRAAFLAELADLRTRRALPFLAYGRMRRGPEFAPAVPNVALDWRLYNTFNRAFTCDSGIETGPEFYDTGTSTVDAVLGSGWSAPFTLPPVNAPRRAPEQVGLAVAEVGGAARTVTLVLDPARQGVPMLNVRGTLRRRGGDEDLGVRQAGSTFALTLAAHEAVLVRLDPSDCTGDACRYRVYRASTPRALLDDASLLAAVTGHGFEDPVATDSRTWFYLVDDGGGWPADTLRVTRSATIELSW